MQVDGVKAVALHALPGTLISAPSFNLVLV
jgi:hypothetical protein